MSEAASAPTGAQRRLPWIKLGVGAVVLLVLALAVVVLRGPQNTLDAIGEAASRGDNAQMARHVDLPALKHSLGRLLLQQMGAALPDDKGNDRQMVGQFLIAGALVGPLVETLVTPSGIGMLLRGQIAARSLGGAATGPMPAYRLSWDGLSTVRAAMLSSDGAPGTLLMVLRRDGIGWKLAGVEMRGNPAVRPVK